MLISCKSESEVLLPERLGEAEAEAPTERLDDEVLMVRPRQKLHLLRDSVKHRTRGCYRLFDTRIG